MARETGQGPGKRCRKRRLSGQGSWSSPSSAVGLGSEGSGGGRDGGPPWAPLPGRLRGLCPTGRGRALRSGLVTAVPRRLPVAGCVVRGGLKPQHLPLHQPGVEAALGQQLLVCALLHHAALVEHHDAVRPLHRAQPVRDDEHRVFPQVAMDGLLDLRTQEGTAHTPLPPPTTPPRPGSDPGSTTSHGRSVSLGFLRL